MPLRFIRLFLVFNLTLVVSGFAQLPVGRDLALHLDSTDRGGIWLASRYHISDSYVIKAGYNISAGQWQIIDYWDDCGKVIASVSEQVMTGQWYDLRLASKCDQISLYVNNKLKCSTTQSTNKTYGQVAFYADHAVIDVDQIQYIDSAPVRDGVRSIYFGYNNIRTSNGNMFRHRDGRLILHTGGLNVFMQSLNNGVSWETTTWWNNQFEPGFAESNIIRLNSDDTNEVPAVPQFPRNRLALAGTTNDMLSWRYLLDVDDFELHDGVFYNLAMYLEDDYIFTMVNVNTSGGYGSDENYLKLTRIERDKMKEYKVFPPLH